MKILDHYLPGPIAMNVRGEQLLRAFAGRRHIAFAMATPVNDRNLITAVSPCVSRDSVRSLKYELPNLVDEAIAYSDRLFQPETFGVFGESRSFHAEYDGIARACYGGGR